MFKAQYAKALFDLAKTSDKLDQIALNFDTFILALKDNPDYVKVLTYPNISLKNKKESVDLVCGSFDPLFKDFLYVLLDNDRMKNVSEIYEEFNHLIDNYMNRMHIVVYSNELLNDNQLEDLKQSLSKKYEGKTLLINNIVDDSLIGGIKIFASGKELDMSLRSKLDQMKSKL